MYYRDWVEKLELPKKANSKLTNFSTDITTIVVITQYYNVATKTKWKVKWKQQNGVKYLVIFQSHKNGFLLHSQLSCWKLKLPW